MRASSDEESAPAGVPEAVGRAENRKLGLLNMWRYVAGKNTPPRSRF